MPASKVANFSSGIEVYGCPVVPSVGGRMCMGDVFYVDSGNTTYGADDTAHGSTKDRPFLTLEYAISQATTNNGDFIILLPGHAETLTAVLTISKAGLTIIGVGNGTLRPTFTQSAAADGISIEGANTFVHNLGFAQSTNNGTGLINIAASNVTIEGCYFNLGAKALIAMSVASGDDCKIVNNEFIITADGPDRGISVEGCTRILIHGNMFDGVGNVSVLTTYGYDQGAFYSTATLGSGNVTHNMFKCGSTSNVVTIYGASLRSAWVFAHNVIRAPGVGEDAMNIGNAVCIENYAGWVGGARGLCIPITAETT